MRWRRAFPIVAVPLLVACSVTLVGTDDTPDAGGDPDATTVPAHEEGSTSDVASETTVRDVTTDDAPVACERPTTPGCPCGTVCASKTCSKGGCNPVVFVTGDAWTGTISGTGATGVARADLHCQEAASKLGRNPVTTFRAWLSETGTSPSSVAFVKSSRPYHLPNGVQVVPSFAQLATGPMLPINRTETNLLLSNAGVWTGTSRTGQPYDDRCNDWATVLATGGFGQTNLATEGWSLAGNADCNDFLHLYCFEQLP